MCIDEPFGKMKVGSSTNQRTDHLKNVFTKVGVGSRSELVGLVFRRDYFPSVASGAVLIGSSGFFGEPR